MRRYFGLLINRFQALPRLLIALAVMLGAVVVPFGTTTAYAASTACATGGPASAAYTITVCVTAPADGAVVSGNQTVSATYSTTGANPGVAKLIFYLGGNYLITDYQPPYTFTLPTTKFVDGTLALEVEALMKDGFTSPRGSVSITLQNGITTPPVNTNTFTPTTGTTPAAGKPFVLVAAGDGADGASNSGYVTDLIQSWNPNLFLYLGDVYEKGTATEFYNWYGPSSAFYGRFKPITDPIIGNHEYEKGVAPGYFDYWNNVPNYYSYNAGGWHIIALNSNCGLTQDCAAGQAQYNWLQRDLSNNTKACTIAYFHHPVFNVGPEGYTTSMNAMWALMAQNGVDIVLAGHDHDYQRWVPLDGNGQPSTTGMTSFVAGTGGHGIQNFIVTDSRMAIGFDTSPFSFGALRLQLNKDGAGFQYINYQGQVLDSGAIPCSGAPVDTTAPSAPANLTASIYSASQADLSWGDSTDNVGVAGYDIYRNSVKVASVGYVNTYRDSGLSLGTTYTYQVKARDAAGNVSAFSNSASVSMPSVLFSDGFESGTASAWTSATNLVVETADHYAGSYSARATSPASAPLQTYASKTFTLTQTDLYYSLAFKIRSLGSTSAYLQRFRTGTNASIMGVFVSGSTGKLGYRNDIAATSVTNGPLVSLNTWHQLQTHVKINGTSSLVEIWLDGVQVTALSRTDSFGTNAIGRVQLGDNSGTNIYDISFDDAAVNTSFINTIDSVAPSTPTGLAVTASTPNSVSLGWNAATDNIGVSGYDLYRSGSFVTTVTGTSTIDTPVSPAFTYQYQVAARDAAGNVSSLSSPVPVTTPADTTSPAVSLTEPTDGLTVSGSLYMAADASDNVAVDHVDFLVNGGVVSSATEAPYDFSWNTASVPDGTLAVITARAVDTSGNATVSASRSVTVNNSAGDTQPPSAPANFAATAAGASRVDLSWSASTDNIGVSAYDVYRDSLLLASVPASSTTYSDAAVHTGEIHQYQVQARDAAGNLSALVSAPSVTVPAQLFSDGFESGDLSQWTNSGLTVLQQGVLEGSYSAHAASSGAGAAYAYKSLNTTQTDLYFRTWFKLNSQGANSAYIQRFRTSTNGAILGVFVSSTGKLGYRNDVAATSTTSSSAVSQGVWHQLQTHVNINGTNSLVEVWLDGAQVSALSKTDSLGTSPIGRVQLGDSTAADVFDASFDEAGFDTSYVNPSNLPYTIIDSGPSGLTASNSASFSFSSTAAGATFECSLDGLAFAACTTPTTLSALSDGPHIFAVRAADTLGSVDATPARQAWTVDTTGPAVTGTSPADGAVDIGTGTGVIAFFSEALDPASLIAANFILTLQGGSTALPASLSYDPATNKASLTPSSALDYLSTYTATLKGGPGGLTDLAGNPLPADVSWSFTTSAPDTTPPTVSLTSPLDGASVSGVVNLTADAADNVGVTQVDFLVNGALVGSDLSAPYSFAWNASGLPNGPVSLSAQAWDARANTTVSVVVTVNIANDVTPPSVPTNLSASTVSGARVDLTWTASTDDVGVAGYDIFRNNSPLASIGALTSFSDTTVLPSANYQYQVRAKDAAGNLSALSASLPVSTPSVLFADPFESGDLSNWTANLGLIVQQQEVFAGLYSARATTSGAAVYAYYQLPAAQYDLYYEARIKILVQDPASSVYVMRFRTADTLSAVGVFVSPTGKLGYRNDISGISNTTTTSVSTNTWHSLQAHVTVDPLGGTGLVELWLDGVPATSQGEVLGNAPIARLQLGDSNTGHTFDIAFDNIYAATFFINPEDTLAPSTPANLAASATSPSVISLTWDAATDNVGVTGYDLYRNGSLAVKLGNVTSYTDSSLTPSTTYTYQLRALDAAGNISAPGASVSATTLPDTTPPSVSLTSPANGLIAGGTISLAASATDDVAVARVEFLVNGALVGTATASPYTYNWNSSTTPDGQVSLSARAVDSSNNAAVSAPVSLTVDNTPPDTSITSGPAALVNTTTANFGLSSSEANSTFVCSLDGAAFGTCASPAAISGLLNGTHNFQVKATDPAGNTDPSPAAWNWTVDIVPPAVTSTNPSNNARNISPLAVITTTFSEAVNPATLTSSSFFITVKNSNTPLAAAVAYNSATNTASLTPSAALVSSTTYAVTVKGGTGGVKDLAGNAMTSDTTWNFTTGSLDLTPPAVSVTSPAGGAKVHGTITLAANASDNVAIASVDFLVNGTVVGTDTSSPYSVTWNSATLPDGAATITARAADTSLNSTTSAGVSITVDNTPPNTTITSGPTGTLSSTSASFSFSSTESGSTFACSLDGSAFSACFSPAAYSGLTSATHNFQVRASDAAGNVDPTPASQSWTVDATPPDTTITAGPTGSIKTTSASFSFTSTEANSTFACSLDGSVFSACTSPTAYNNLANGSHTFQVRATDSVGNTDLTPASRTWTVDNTAPSGVKITSPAAGATVTGQINITATASDNIGVVSVAFYVDGQLLSTSTTSPYSAAWNTKKYSKGSHSLYVIASDAAGNTTQSATISVTVN